MASSVTATIRYLIAKKMRNVRIAHIGFGPVWHVNVWRICAPGGSSGCARSMSLSRKAMDVSPSLGVPVPGRSGVVPRGEATTLAGRDGLAAAREPLPVVGHDHVDPG